MRLKAVVMFMIALLCAQTVANCGGYSNGEKWYQNPLGFDPLNLHKSNGFFIPLIAAATCAILTKSDSAYKDGKMAFSFNSGTSWGYQYPYTSLNQYSIGFEDMTRWWMSLGGDFDFNLARDEFNNTSGVGFNVFVRFYPVNNDDWRLYFESGAGVSNFVNNFPTATDQDPRSGEKWDCNTKYGIGGEINFVKNASVVFGVRHLRISRGLRNNYDGEPSFNSNGIVLGFSYRP